MTMTFVLGLIIYLLVYYVKFKYLKNFCKTFYVDSWQPLKMVAFSWRRNYKAVAAVNDDIKTWADEHAGEDVKIDFGKMSAYYAAYDDDVGCEWQIEEVDIPIEGHIAFSLK